MNYMKIAILYLILVAILLIIMGVAVIAYISEETKKYKQIHRKIQKGYKIYIDGIEVDKSQIDIYLYSLNKLSVDDDKKKICLSIYDKRK